MISTHILDTTLGKPAPNVRVRLEKSNGSSWDQIGIDLTNQDGRIVFNCPYANGDYRLIFETLDYYKALNQESFFIDAVVAFRVNDMNRKYHVPLLLNPFAYSTYRGS
jgi:5-hydroxyisourate hydrolase